MAKLSKAHMVCFVAASVASFSVFGQEQAKTAGDLAREHSRKIMLKVQADAAQEELRLLQAQSKAREILGAASSGTSVAPATGAIYEQGDVAPVVAGVFGGNGDIYATLLYAGGTRFDARAGREVPGGYTVITVQPNRVGVRSRTGRTVWLKFSNVAPAAEVAAGGAAAATSSPFAGGTVPPPPGIAPMTGTRP
ncbi:type IV pilus biogenesis protein PilP [Xanthomonas euvesicatoria pv. allii]|uniref:type IV pilus biogenesis protein PilP n=1 Tax=Xanthomonas euvesicatoria TaxID=456327 RepID=UPI00240739AA|nr:type IV pilus biogenesis protein PilP [Xanthomonas euvesicatoria]MCP3050743.1 type IV pilus biogenesis protein PilP [Xanthomonas euvesicatoria pv. allii]